MGFLTFILPLLLLLDFLVSYFLGFLGSSFLECQEIKKASTRQSCVTLSPVPFPCSYSQLCPDKVFEIDDAWCYTPKSDVLSVKVTDGSIIVPELPYLYISATLASVRLSS